jgi:biopolymer transport protein ExbD
MGDIKLPDHYKRMLLTKRPSRRRVAKKRTDPYRRINAAPLASIMFALLFLFMARTRDHRDLSHGGADLPKTKNHTSMPGALRDDAMRIGVTAGGDVLFDDIKIDLCELADEIRAFLARGAERRGYLSVDTRTKYLNITVVLREVRLAGIENVSFLTN